MIFIYVISTKLVDIDFSSLFPSYEKRQYAASNWFFLSCWCIHREWLRWLHCIGAAKKQAWWELHDSFKLPHAELSHQRTCVSISIYSLVFEMLPCCSGYQYSAALFKKPWTQDLYRFRSCSRRVGKFKLPESLKIVLNGFKAK